jgi:hypothetical protein
MIKNVLAFGFAALTLAACDNTTIETGTTSGGSTGGTTGGDGGGVNPNPYGGYQCPADPANPGAPARYYPGGPLNPNLGILVGQVFPDIALGGGYMNLSTPTAALDTQGFFQDQVSFHDLYCSGKFKVALLDISAGWCEPCNIEGGDLPIHGTPNWLATGGIVFSVLGEGANKGSYHAEKSDLDLWISKHQTNYPLVLSPDGLIATITNLVGWPTNMFIDLTTMTVLDEFSGYNPCNGNTCADKIYTDMPMWLSAVK